VQRKLQDILKCVRHCAWSSWFATRTPLWREQYASLRHNPPLYYLKQIIALASLYVWSWLSLVCPALHNTCSDLAVNLYQRPTTITVFGTNCKESNLTICESLGSALFHMLWISCHGMVSGHLLRLLAPWTTRLLPQWMLHWWRVNGSTVCEPFPLHLPTNAKYEAGQPSNTRVASLSHNETGSQTQLSTLVAQPIIELSRFKKTLIVILTFSQV